METNPTASPVSHAPAPANPGMFGTKIPSTVAFAVGILLFFMPFVDIKCNDMSLQTVSGVQLATGFKMKNSSSDNSFLNDLKSDTVDETITKTTTKTDKKEPNLYAMVALGLGVVGLILSFTNSRASMGMGIVAGVAAAGALIGLMLDVKKKVKLDLPDMSDKTPDNDVGNTIDKVGKEVDNLADTMRLTVDFTPWFFVAVVAFLAAAFFCYKRMTSIRS
jgi:predicted RND superfamily exporter protein